jgi:hypothetical protein
MNIDLDAALSRFAAAPAHPGLANLEAEVFRRIAEQSRDDSRSPVRFSVAAAVGAMLMGVAGAGLTSPVQAPTLSPFGPSTPLVPSTLLATSL